MAAPKTEVISTRIPPRDAQILAKRRGARGRVVVEVASRALRDYTARLTVRSEGASSVMAQSV